ncbi:MAG TPA: hypothetical protein VFD49_22230 [Candidatus Dormibacteraeota bacterium]|nr:hypothetical protein [Candidatus Dormibacteraeota bacterium]
MGSWFRLQAGARSLPPLSELLSGWADLETVERSGHPARWPGEVETPVADPALGPAPSLLLYRRGISTRSLELSIGDGDLALHAPSCTASEDLELAVALMARAGELTGCAIRLEDGEVLSPERLRRRCDRRWASERLHDQAESLAALVAERGAVVVMGPARPFHLGPRLLGQLRDARIPETFAERLIAAMRSAQWPPGDWYAAHVMHVRTPSGRHEFTAAVWGEGVGYVFPAVDYLVLASAGSGRRHLMVPPEAAPRIAGDRCRYLDEVQLLVEAIAGPEWRALWHRAEEHQVPLPD